MNHYKRFEGISVWWLHVTMANDANYCITASAPDDGTRVWQTLESLAVEHMGREPD